MTTRQAHSEGEALPFAVQLRGIRKVYGHCVANDMIDLDVPAGSIHGLLGENGAGKSTAMKILYGLIQPDAGEIRIDGRLSQLGSPVAAKELGIGMVHQHFMLS